MQSPSEISVKLDLNREGRWKGMMGLSSGDMRTADGRKVVGIRKVDLDGQGEEQRRVKRVTVEFKSLRLSLLAPTPVFRDSDPHTCCCQIRRGF